MVSYPKEVLASANQNWRSGLTLNGTTQIYVQHIPKKGERSYDPSGSFRYLLKKNINRECQGLHRLPRI